MLEVTGREGCWDNNLARSAFSDIARVFRTVAAKKQRVMHQWVEQTKCVLGLSKKREK